MARQVAPGTPTEIKAQQFKVDMPDWSAFEKMGDDKIKAANANFTLYADALIKTESAKLYEQYKNDPIQLSNALGKLPDMLKGLPEEIQNGMTKKLYLTGIGLVQKAQSNQLVQQDLESQKNGETSAQMSKALLSQAYQNILQNHISTAENKNPVMDDVFLEQVMNLNSIADLKNHAGKNIYSDTQRKSIKNIDDLELEGFKQFFDQMLINDNDKLEQSQDYYTKFILAPERFMKENYMNRETYDKARAYAEKELKRAGADIKNARFKQSIREAVELQVSDLPGKLDNLKESGMLDSNLIGKIEKVNVKFNDIDPSKPESPVALLDLLSIVNETRYNPAPTTEAEQQKILEQGTAALDSIAEYAQAYGLSPSKVRNIRETVANLETERAFAPILQNFGDIIDNFESKMTTVRNISTGKGGLKTAWQGITLLDKMSYDESVKLIRLNNLLASATDTINQQIRKGDWAGVRQTQKAVQKGAAQIKYDWVDWEEAENNPDYRVNHNGRMVRPKDFTFDGDVIFEIVE